MKRFVLILFAIFTCVVANAEQITINWLNEDKTINQTTTCTVGGDVVMPNNIPQKRGYTFKGYVDNYTPVEYIEGTGSQLINTGITEGPNIHMKTKIGVVATRSVVFFGANANYADLWLGSDGNSKIVSRRRDYLYFNAILTKGDILEVDWNRGALTFNINGLVYNGSFANSVTQASNIFIFANNNVGGGTAMKLYYFQIYDKDVLVRDFIPVVDSKGVACLYDKIEHKFYYNIGSGEFISGQQI